MRYKSILLAFVLLLMVVAVAKTNEADYNVDFTVTATLPKAGFGHSYYCPVTLQTALVAYNVYSESWQCVTFPVGTQLKGRLESNDQRIEVIYNVKGDKFDKQKYAVSSSQAVH
jgi:hypothetical protein